MVDRDDSPAGEILEAYSAEYVHGPTGEKAFWDIFTEVFPEKEEMTLVEEAMEGVLDLSLDDKDTTDSVLQKQRTANSKCVKKEIKFPEVAQGYLLMKACGFLVKDDQATMDRKNNILSMTAGSYDVAKLRKVVKILYPKQLPKPKKVPKVLMLGEEKPQDEPEPPDWAIHMIVTSAGAAILVSEAAEADDVNEPMEEDGVNWALATWAKAKKRLGNLKTQRGSGAGGQRNVNQAPHMGRITKNVKCFNCRLRGHFAKDCPKPKQKRDVKGKGKGNYFVVTEELYMTVEEVEDVMTCEQVCAEFSLWLTVGEGKAVPDAGAGIPAAGPRALRRHNEYLKEHWGLEMVPVAADVKMRFGNDSACGAGRAYMVPIGLNNKYVGVAKIYEVPEPENQEKQDRSEQGTPLLLSNGQVSAVGGVIHTHKHTIVAEHLRDEVLQLGSLPTGHHELDICACPSNVKEILAERREPLIRHKHLVIYANEQEDYWVAMIKFEVPELIQRMLDEEGVQLAYVRKHVTDRKTEYGPMPGEKNGPKCGEALVDWRLTRAEKSCYWTEMRQRNEVEEPWTGKTYFVKATEACVCEIVEEGQNEEEPTWEKRTEEILATEADTEEQEYDVTELQNMPKDSKKPEEPDEEHDEEQEWQECEEDEFYEVPESKEEAVPDSGDLPEKKEKPTEEDDEETEFAGKKGVMEKANRTLLARMVMILMGGMAAASQAKVGPVMWVAENVHHAAQAPVESKGVINLGTESGREEMWNLVMMEKPYMLVLKPPCENLFKDMDHGKKSYVGKLMESICHVKTCVEVAGYQRKHGRHFILEAPTQQKEWWLSEVSRRMCEDQKSDLRQCANAIGQMRWNDGDDAIRFVTDLPELATTLQYAHLENVSIQMNEQGHRYRHWEPWLTQQVLNGVKHAAERERSEASIALLQEDKEMHQEAVDALQHIFAIGAKEDYEDVKEHLKRKKKGVAAQPVDWEEKVKKSMEPVQRLHTQLGHPSTVDMLRLLHHGGAHPAAILAARRLQCSICDEQKKPKVQRFADMPYAPRPLSRMLGCEGNSVSQTAGRQMGTEENVACGV